MSAITKNMYDIVQEVLGATTKAEAESILYGSRGMLENSQAYYGSIVYRFIKFNTFTAINKYKNRKIFNHSSQNNLFLCSR